MPVDWKQLSGFERAEKILENIDGLHNDDIQACYNEWSELTFEVSVEGIIKSEAVLQQIGVRHLLKRLGRWEEEERRRNDELERTIRKINK